MSKLYMVVRESYATDAKVVKDDELIASLGIKEHNFFNQKIVFADADTVIKLVRADYCGRYTNLDDAIIEVDASINLVRDFPNQRKC